ncbi:MAG: hypothetical protein P4L51_24880 [Puia sp.]|nr:hypothetical protein [Puia sp.]
MLPNDSMCTKHHCPKGWVCHYCANPHEALCPACFLEHQVRDHHIDKIVAITDEVRKDSDALKARLGPDSPTEKVIVGLKKRIWKALKDVAEATRAEQAEIGRVQRELDLRKKEAAIADVEAQKKLGELLMRLGVREATLDKARAVISGEDGEVAGKSDEVMREIKELLEQTGKDVELGAGKMDELLAGIEQVVAEIKKAHGDVRPELRSREEKKRDFNQVADLKSDLQAEQSRTEGLVMKLANAKKELAKMAKENRELEEILKNWGINESLRNSFKACDASISGFKSVFEEKKAAIDQQQDFAKKGDMIKELGESLKKVEDEFKQSVGKVNEQLDKKAAEVRKIRRVLDGNDEEVKKRTDGEEKEEKKKYAERGEHVLLTRGSIAEKLLAEYKGHPAYEKVKDAYQRLASNSENDWYFRTIMLIIVLLRAHTI